MTEHILISPLGFSPGAISGALFGLRRGIPDKDGQVAAYPINKVVTLGTENPRVREAAGALTPLLQQVHVTYEPDYIPQAELRQADDAAATFLLRFGQILEASTGQDKVAHVVVTGGRTGMGTLASLAASLYGADHLWHLWVAETIEEKGRIGDLPQPFDQSNIYLNPPPGQYELVALPFWDMRTLHGALWDFYHTGQLSGEYERLSPVFASFRTPDLDLAHVLPACMPTYMQQEVGRILREYPDMNGAARRQAMKQVLVYMERDGLLDKLSMKNLSQALALGLPPGGVLQAGRHAPDRSGFWAFLRNNHLLIELIVAVQGHTIDTASLLEAMVKTFSVEELNTLCFKLSIRHEDLPDALTPKVRELINYVERRGSLAELVAYLQQERPQVAWLPQQAEPLAKKIPPDLFLLHALQTWLVRPK